MTVAQPAVPRVLAAPEADIGGDLAGRRILVTGGSSGIGAASAAALARRGACVAISGRDQAALAAVAAGTGGTAIAADLRAPGAPEELAARAREVLGGLDTVVYSAGSGWAGPVADMAPTDIDALIDLNLRAPMHLVRAVLPGLIARRRGQVVLVGSIAGLFGVPREVVYSATKAGLAGYADALRAELATSGVVVSLVSPAAVATSFFDRRNRPYERHWPRPMPVDRAAAAVVRCVVSGTADVVVPGWMTLPARLRGMAPRMYRHLATRFG